MPNFVHIDTQYACNEGVQKSYNSSLMFQHFCFELSVQELFELLPKTIISIASG